MNIGPEKYFQSGIATNLIRTEFNDIDGMKRSWLSQLAIPGHVLIDTGAVPKQHYLVVDVCSFGVTALAITLTKHDGQVHADVDFSRGRIYIHIKSVDGWKCAKVRAVPPALSKRAGSPEQLRGVHMILPDNKQAPLIRFSSYYGFKHLNVQELRELANIVECKKSPLPKTEAELVHLLVQEINPGATEETILSYVAERKMRRPACVSVLSHEGAMDFASDILDKDTVEEVEDSAKKYKQYIAAAKAVAPKAKAKAAAGAGGAKKKTLGVKDVVMLDMLNKHLPNVPGCKIWSEEVWHTRLRVTYPTVSPPGYSGMCYNDACDVSKRKAGMYCLW